MCDSAALFRQVLEIVLVVNGNIERVVVRLLLRERRSRSPQSKSLWCLPLPLRLPLRGGLPLAGDLPLR